MDALNGNVLASAVGRKSFLPAALETQKAVDVYYIARVRQALNGREVRASRLSARTHHAIISRCHIQAATKNTGNSIAAASVTEHMLRHLEIEKARTVLAIEKGSWWRAPIAGMGLRLHK
jgi:hypothetical protein